MCRRESRGTSPKQGPEGRGPSHPGIRRTSPDTIPTRSHACRTSPRDSAASDPPDASAIAVLRIPRVVRQVRVPRVIPIAEPRRGPPPTRIFPLRLRRQPIHTRWAQSALPTAPAPSAWRSNRWHHPKSPSPPDGEVPGVRAKLGLFPITARYSPCVTSYFPIQNPRLIVTSVWDLPSRSGPSFRAPHPERPRRDEHHVLGGSIATAR
jgi:hypothetical protein